MKYLIAPLFIFLALPAFSADKVLGPVIAIERDLTNVADNCLKTTKESENTKGYFTCGFRFLKDSEFSLKRSSLIRYETSTCHVTADDMTGAVIMGFNSKTSKDVSAATACLHEALATKTEMKVLVYSVQK